MGPRGGTRPCGGKVEKCDETLRRPLWAGDKNSSASILSRKKIPFQWQRKR